MKKLCTEFAGFVLEDTPEQQGKKSLPKGAKISKNLGSETIAGIGQKPIIKSTQFAPQGL